MTSLFHPYALSRWTCSMRWINRSHYFSQPFHGRIIWININHILKEVYVFSWIGLLSSGDCRVPAAPMLEGINSMVQSAKSSARGLRTTKNLILIIYLRLGKLQFNLPTWNSEEPGSDLVKRPILSLAYMPTHLSFICIADAGQLCGVTIWFALEKRDQRTSEKSGK